jgi:hypothetical protein
MSQKDIDCRSIIEHFCKNSNTIDHTQNGIVLQIQTTQEAKKTMDIPWIHHLCINQLT